MPRSPRGFVAVEGLLTPSDSQLPVRVSEYPLMEKKMKYHLTGGCCFTGEGPDTGKNTTGLQAIEGGLSSSKLCV